MLISTRNILVHHEDDGTIDVEAEDSVSHIAESISVTSSSTFIARQIKLNKKRAKLEAKHAFEKAEAKHALEIAKVEERRNIAAAKLDVEERLIGRGSSVAVSSKVGLIDCSINLMESAQNFVKRFAQTQHRAQRKCN